MIRASLFAFAILAAACTPPAETPIEEQPVAEQPAMPQTAAEATAQDTCGASQYRSMVGQSLAAVQLPAEANIRVIQPDTIVTQDFNPERINMIVGADGVITGFECY